MANVTYGPTIADARGLCGPIVYTRTHAGACIQARPRVVNPRTPAQLWVRRLVGLTNQAWSTTLSPSDRAAWAAAAAQVTERTTVGTQFTHTPQSYYTRHALNAANAGGSTSVAPPSGPLQHSPGALTLTAGGSPPSIQLTTANPIPDGCGVILMATPSLRAGIYQYQRYYRQLRNADLSPVLPTQMPDLTTPYLATHGGWQIGQTIALTAAFVRFADGEKGPTTMTTALSTAAIIPTYSAQVTITPDQFAALLTTGVPLLPAPGFGLMLQVVSGAAHYTQNTIPPVFAPSDFMWASYNGDPNNVIFLGETGNGSPDTADVWWTFPNYCESTHMTTNPNNQPLLLQARVVSGVLGDGTIEITLNYQVFPAP